MNLTELAEIADTVDLLVNISGHLTLERLKARFRKRAFIDFDRPWLHAVLARERSDRGGSGIITSISPSARTSEWPIATFRPARSPGNPFGSRYSSTSADLAERATHTVHDRGELAWTVRACHRQRRAVRPEGARVQKIRTASNADRPSVRNRAGRHPADRRDVELLQTNAWTIVDPMRVARDPFRAGRCTKTSVPCDRQGVHVSTSPPLDNSVTGKHLRARPR